MSVVNPDAYGTSRPKLEPDDLEEDVAVLTIDDFEEVEVDDANTESGKRMSAYLTFTETGDKVVWLNKTAVTALIHFYGNDSDLWKGQPCPVEQVKGRAFDKPYHKVSVVPKDAWPEYIPELAPQRVTMQRRRAAKKATRKTARRKTATRKKKTARKKSRRKS